ncbi:MAG: WG repeat-containing protein [Chryseosolibacter sp.]
MKLIIGVLLFLSGGVTFAQSGGAEKPAMKHMEKHRWQKAEDKLRKSLSRDTLNAPVRYLLSVFYFHADNPARDLDSAYHYAVTALDDYALSPFREREKLRKMSLDSVRLISLRAQIDSTAFEVAREVNTEAAYLEFLSDFPSAVQRDLAARLRDEVAYREALDANTHQAFLTFLNRYPDASKAPEARAHYERLLYTAETRDQRLASFERFLKDHPETPYRKEIDRHIFEISTADGTVESFLAFITRYPANDLVKKAEQMIFHMLADVENPQWPVRFLNDSLRNLLGLNTTYLVPVLQNNRYGFLDENGREVLAPQFKNIHPDYLCGNITDEVLMVDNKLVARNGSIIYQGDADELNDLGVGFLKINTPAGAKVIHKAGFVLHDSAEDCRILARRYVAVKKNNTWLLYTLTGRLLDEHGWDDIYAIQNVIAFRSNKNVFIAPNAQLGRSADGGALLLSDPFDEIKVWPPGLLWGKAGDFQGVLDESLQGVIRFDRHILNQTFFGATARVPNGYTLYNWAGRRSTTFDQVHVFDPWVTVRRNGSWFLFDPYLMKDESKAYDSIRTEGPFPVGIRADSITVHFAQNHVATFFRPLKVAFVPGMDSTSFLMVADHHRIKSVFDIRGRKLFSAAFDAIEYAGQGIFVITRREKKGLLNMQGAALLPAAFDAIGSVKGNVISILKNKRFGAYHIQHKKLIKPQYDRNIVPYTETVVSTFREGHYGFLGWDNKPVSLFAFDEIRYWDDSVALVRNGADWNFYDIAARQNTERNLRKIVMIRNTTDEKIAIIQKGNNFGVIANGGKVIIPVTFTDIVNLGSTDQPLYFTEKHVQEASLYIVIYYDHAGNMLRKEIYDYASDYDRIYCTD